MVNAPSLKRGGFEPRHTFDIILVIMIKFKLSDPFGSTPSKALFAHSVSTMAPWHKPSISPRFLLSDEASFITGVTLPVDGGFVCYSGV